MKPVPKGANPLYVPTGPSRAPRPRTDRPARQQITEEPKESQDNVVGEYNIWYHRHLGYDQKTAKPETRISVADDTGMTTAGRDANICLNFARGNCIKGYKCNYKHQLPTEDDELRVSMLKDVFGRGRHGTDREDMDGTGNFNRNNRTLYLGGVVCKADLRETEKLIKADFAQYGELEYVRAIPSKAIGFVRFKLRVAAEFAREAMNGQTTPYGDVQVKWAHVDPNPLAKEFDKRADEALAQYAIAKRIMEMSDDKRAAWQQMQQVQNGVYPTNAPALAAPPAPQQTMAAIEAGSEQQQNAVPALPPPPVAAPPGVDPARAAQFAAYWAYHHACETAKQLGLEPPPPPQELAGGAGAGAGGAPSAGDAAPNSNAPTKDAATDPSEVQTSEAFTNPHTGETVAESFAVNPYSQAPHPYAYRDYGWNRPKKNGSEAEKDRKRQKRAMQEAMQEDEYEAQKDPNYSYGPSSSSSQKRERESSRRRGNNSGGDQVTPGAPAQQAQQQQPQVLVPAARGKKAKATQQELDALMNDEPLLFN